MASFPDRDLIIGARAAFGADVQADPSSWVWTDLTDRLLSTLITCTRGTAVGAGSRQTLWASGIELTNEDGYLTPYLASSPYHPYVDAGTPFVVEIRTTDDVLLRDTFTRTVSPGLGTSDSGFGYSFTTGGTAASSVNGSVGQFATPAVNTVYRATLLTYTVRDVDFTFDTSIPSTATGQTVSTGGTFRLQDTSNFYWASPEFRTTGQMGFALWKAVGGVFTLIASYTPGVAYSPGQVIRCRVQMVGDRYRAKVWPAAGAEPAAWGVQGYDTAFTTAGRIGWAFWLQTGNTNTLPFTISFDNLSVVQPPTERVEGFIADIRPTFLPTGGGLTWSKVQIDVGGVDVILGRRDESELSPLRRSIEKTPNIAPVAYWPIEDERNSTFAASAFPDGPKLIATGPIVFAFDTGVPTEQFLTRYGSKPLASVAAGARLAGSIPNSGVSTEWATSIFAQFFKPDVTGTEMRIMQWTCSGGSLNRWALVATNTSYIVRAYNDGAPSSTNVATYTPAGGVFYGQLNYTIEAIQNGANVDVGFFINDASYATGSVAGTISAPSYVSVNPDQVNTTASLTPFGLRFLVGHVRFVPEITQPDSPYYTVPETGEVIYAVTSWLREPDHRRLSRLIADEEKVQFRFLGNPATTGYTLLGAQPDGNFKDLVERAVESSSGGVLFEKRFGYAYLPRSTRYNRPAGLVIDMATYGTTEDRESVLAPRLARRAPNSISVARRGGVESTFAASAAYRARKGTIPQRYELDVYTDDDPREHAAWRTHVNTDAQGADYPDLSIDLAGTPALIDAWLVCDIGARIQRTNQPTIAGIGTIDQVADGIKETFGPDTWKVAVNASPAEVFDTGIWDDANTLWALSATTLQSGITSTALSMSVNGETLATGAVNWLMEIDGEWMTVTNVSGSGPYTLTIFQRSVNGKVASHLAGAAVTFAKPSRYAL